MVLIFLDLYVYVTILYLILINYMKVNQTEKEHLFLSLIHYRNEHCANDQREIIYEEQRNFKIMEYLIIR